MFWIILLSLSFIGGLITSFSFENGVRILLLDVVVGVYGLWFLLFSPQKKEALKKYLPIFGPFVGVAIASILLSRYSTPLLYIARFVAYSMFTVSINFDTELKKNALEILWSSGVMIALLGLGQYFLYPNLRNLSYLGWDPHEFRVFSTLFDPNFTGIVLVLTLILGAYLRSTQQQKNSSFRLFLTIGSGVTFVMLLLTYSRGSFVAALGSMAVFLISRNKFKLFFGSGVLFLLLLLILPRPGGEGVNLLRTISIGSRIENSSMALDQFWNSPIFGNGSFETTVHNGWLYILSTTGIVGFGTYLWIWRRLLKTNLKTFKKNPHFELLLVSFVAIGIHSIFDNSLFYPHVMYWMWVLVGIYGLNVTLRSSLV